MRISYVGTQEVSPDCGKFTVHLGPRIGGELENFPDEFRFGPIDIANLFAAGCPFSMDFDIRFRSGYGGSVWIDLSFAGQARGKFEFLVDWKAQVVHLEEMELHHAFRNTGIFKAIMSCFIAFVETTGITRIEANMRDVGGYVFARMGFLPTPEEWLELRDQLRLSVSHVWHLLPPELQSRLTELLQSDDPRSLWEISDMDFRLDPSDLASLQRDRGRKSR